MPCGCNRRARRRCSASTASAPSTASASTAAPASTSIRARTGNRAINPTPEPAPAHTVDQRRPRAGPPHLRIQGRDQLLLEIPQRDEDAVLRLLPGRVGRRVLPAVPLDAEDLARGNAEVIEGPQPGQRLRLG